MFGLSTRPLAIRRVMWVAAAALLSATVGCGEDVGEALTLADACVAPATAQTASQGHTGRRFPEGSIDGRMHNEAVREMLVRMTQVAPSPSTLDEAYEAMVTAIGDVAARKGVDRNEAVLTSRARVVEQLDRYPEVGQARSTRARFAAMPGVLARFKEQRAAKQEFEQRLARRRAERGTRGMASLVTVTLDDAVADVIDLGADGSYDAASALSRTDTVTAAYAAVLNAPSADTMYLSEDVTDSSRTFWEVAALELWVAASGDTTIFYPASNQNKTPAACDTRPTANIMVIACPACWRAAGVGVVADAVTGFLQYRSGRRGMDLAIDVAGASAITAVGTLWVESPSGSTSGLISKSWNWIKGKFGG